MSIKGDAHDSVNYFDQDDILEKWGFADNICHHCGKRNSDLNGLLMQCGKCKKGKIISFSVLLIVNVDLM